MSRTLKIILAFMAGLVAGEAAALGWYIVATSYFGVFDRDGGLGMGTAFVIGPILALVAGSAAAIATALLTRPS